VSVEDPHWGRAQKNNTLAERLATGHPIEPSRLTDTVYRGISLGLPRFIEKLSWVVFAKTFARDPSSDGLRGWNVRCHQDPIDAPVRYRVGKDGAPLSWGPYTLRSIRDDDLRPRPYGPGLMIDYSLGGTVGGSLGRTRDPLVAVTKDSVDVLLGWSFLAIGSGWSTPSYFALFRDRALDHQHPF
jgi:hypothetical protein